MMLLYIYLIGVVASFPLAGLQTKAILDEEKRKMSLPREFAETLITAAAWPFLWAGFLFAFVGTVIKLYVKKFRNR